MRAMPHTTSYTKPPAFDSARLRAENEALRREVRVLRLQVGELERLADSDTLTPLRNRRAFLREVERSLARVARHGVAAVVMLADFDGLKAINDTGGHHVGDAALILVGHTLQAQLRASDVAARIGGDEFGLILEALDPVAAQAKVKALCAAVRAESVEGWPLSISMGFAEMLPDDSVDSVIARADAMMYANKRAQRSAR